MENEKEVELIKFKQERKEAAEKIDQLKELASNAIDQATELADKYGIVFRVGLINHYNTYAPERPKSFPADMCMSDDYDDPEEESYEYEGWQASGC